MKKKAPVSKTEELKKELGPGIFIVIANGDPLGWDESGFCLHHENSIAFFTSFELAFQAAEFSRTPTNTLAAGYSIHQIVTKPIISVVPKPTDN